MKRSVAVPLWDLFLVVSFLIPFPIVAAFADGRAHFGIAYIAAWLGIFVVAWGVGRRRGVTLRSYLRQL
jgi:hypothetical protein